MNRALVSIIVLVMLIFCFFSTSFGVTRGRVQIQNNTVVTDQGTLLRSVDFDIWKYLPLQTNFTKDPDSYLKIKNIGYNCIRIPCIYSEIESGGFAYYTIEQTVKLLDIAVDNAEAAGMYVCIDYHDCGTYDLSHMINFWSKVAPRYADRFHVFYEMANEPVAWSPLDYTTGHLEDFTHVYNLIRKLAPDTHIVLLSFAVAGEGMLGIADQLYGIDWRNASVGFHPYWITTSHWIKALKKDYPVIATEFSTPDFNDPAMDSSGIDGERWVVKLMEELGISWMLWSMGVYKDNLWIIENQIADAQNRGYMWTPDEYAPKEADTDYFEVESAVLNTSNVQVSKYDFVEADFIVTAAESSKSPLLESLVLTDIGNPKIAATFDTNNSRYFIRASGAGIWNQSDQFGMAHATVTGDCEIISRVVAIEKTDGWAKAGVMIRESLKDDCKYAATVITPANGIIFQRRLVEGDTSFTTLTSGNTPIYVKLIRRGDLFSSLYSEDGENWLEIGSQIISMKNTVFIGLCGTSHSDNVSSEAEFDNFQIIF